MADSDFGNFDLQPPPLSPPFSDLGTPSLDGQSERIPLERDPRPLGAPNPVFPRYPRPQSEVDDLANFAPRGRDPYWWYNDRESEPLLYRRGDENRVLPEYQFQGPYGWQGGRFPTPSLSHRGPGPVVHWEDLRIGFNHPDLSFLSPQDLSFHPTSQYPPPPGHSFIQSSQSISGANFAGTLASIGLGTVRRRRSRKRRA